MFSFLNKDQKQIIEYITEYIQKKESINYKSAKRMVLDSDAFISTLKEDPEFVAHYGIEYWGDLVIQQSSLCCK